MRNRATSQMSLGQGLANLGASQSRASFNNHRSSLTFSLASRLSQNESSIYDSYRVGMELKKDQQEQKRRQKIQRILSGNDYQITTYKIISTNKFQYTIMSCVIINILLLIMPQMPPNTPFAKWFQRNLIPLTTVDSIFLSIYITEMCLKIFACRREYFHNKWDVLDCAIVAFSLLDLGFSVHESASIAVQSTVQLKAAKQFKVIRLLRATRMLRVLRTLKFVDRLQRYAETILNSMRQLDAILSLVGGVMGIFASVGCAVFGELLPRRFGNITMTLFTLMQLITLDDWYEIVQEGSVKHGEFSTSLFIFIILYIFIMVFVIFNLLLGVLVENFQVANDEEEIRLEEEELHCTNSLDNMLDHPDSDEDADGEVYDEEEYSRRKTIEMDAAKVTKLLQDKLKRTGNDGGFSASFAHLPNDRYKLQEWYYRLLPACERQEFLFTNQFNAFSKMVEEAVFESEDL